MRTPDITQETAAVAIKDPHHHAGAAAAMLGTPPLAYNSLTAPATPQSSTALARSVSNTACSEGSAASTSQSLAHSQLGEPHNRMTCYDEPGMTPVFEPNPMVPESKLAAWQRQSSSGKGLAAAVAAAAACGGAAAAAAKGGVEGGKGAHGGSETSSSGSSGAKEAAFAEQLRRELHPQHGNPNIIGSTAAAQLQPGHSSSKNSPRRALLQAPAAAAGGAAAKAQFENAFAAMLGLPEGKVIRDTYLNTFGTMSDPSMRLKFQGLLTLASDRNAKATFFWPLDGGFASISKQLCMSVQQIQDTLASAPDVALQYMNINILNATPGGTVIRDTYLNTFGTMSDPSMRLKFQGLLTLASDRNAKATFFWPLDGGFASISKQLCMSVQQIQDTLASAPDVALQYMNINILNGTTLMSSDFKDGANLQTMEPGFTLPLRKRVVISKQLCMSVQQIQDTLASAPDVAMQYMNINILNGTTLMSSDFKDGANLQTMEPGFTLPLRKRVVNGATQWYFPKAAYNQDDVTLQRLDVTAGSAVIHFVDYLIFSPAQRTFWAQQAKNMKCGEGGGPVAAAKGADQPPPQQQQQSQGVNAGMIAGIAIAGAVAIAALVVLLVLLRRRPLAKRLSGAFGVASPQQQQKPGDAATRGMMPPGTPPYGGGAGSGSGDAGWQGLGSDFPDEAAAMRTPDITQETAPVAIK
eukprot:jgi/Sobl393_1/20071/SZX62598.1